MPIILSQTDFQCAGASWEYSDTDHAPAYTYGPVIHANANFFAMFSLGAQRFILTHECAHAHGVTTEEGADRYAMKVIPYSPALLEEVCDTLRMGGQDRRCEILKAEWPKAR